MSDPTPTDAEMTTDVPALLARADLVHLGRQVALVGDGDGFTTEVCGVKIAKCDDRGRTEADIRAEKAEAEVERLARWKAEALSALAGLRADLAAAREAKRKIEQQFRELQSESRILPCDAACTDYPEEDCSRHGREPAELWHIIAEIQAQRDEAREALARVEALVAPQWRTNLGGEYEHAAEIVRSGQAPHATAFEVDGEVEA